VFVLEPGMFCFNVEQVVEMNQEAAPRIHRKADPLGIRLRDPL